MKRVQFWKTRSYFPRKGWAIKFKQMHQEGDDKLLDEDWLDKEWLEEGWLEEGDKAH
ncbi:MAG: hypothetical protein ABFS38_17470 [Bacteroidota bacterium]